MTTDELSYLLVIDEGAAEPTTPEPAGRKPAEAKGPDTAATAVHETPDRGHTREVPVDLLEALEACWSRCRMAGMERARGERWTHVIAISSTLLGAVTGAAAYTALQSQTDLASQWIVTIVAISVAVLGALQTFMTQQVTANAAAMDDVAGVFHGLHIRLMAAVSECRLTGALPDPGLLAEAQKARADHLKSMPQERPTFRRADSSVQRDLKALGLLV
jgi:hypothetical protein